MTKQTVFDKCYALLLDDISLDSKDLERMTGHSQNTISSIISHKGITMKQLRQEIYLSKVLEVKNLTDRLERLGALQ